ncbi:MAG: uroporphyrinogen-III C-methyltransferase [Candidatus Omnitrophica bacterium]|nr:uroporphyrinogen-III C-methyltransferase [Candidatus Omnitrophota bacterium]
MRRRRFKKGKVFLVGAGPGDPGLITVKGLELLQRADAVVYDALVDTSLLDHARAGARRIFMGKRMGQPSAKQGEIHRLLIREARRGRAVVRLKGGDPLLFGRGAEEASALRRARVPYEIVPGVSSAWAVPAYAGISLTDRRLSSSVMLTTAHEASFKRNLTPMRWKRLARGADTLVIFMGLSRLADLTRHLMRAGLKSSAPCALLYWGTTSRQRSLFSTLGRVAQLAERLRFKAPSLLIVGRVARQRRLGRWWHPPGLKGKRILVTRPRGQAGALARLLRARGARVVTAATIRIEPASSYKALDRAIYAISRFDWLVFTSANGVEAFFRRWKKVRPGQSLPAKLRVAVIGPATRAAARGYRLKVHLSPKQYVAEGLLQAFRDKRLSLKGKHVLLPRARDARPTMVQGLRRMGAKVEVVEAYHTAVDPRAARALRAVSANGGVDLVTFTSSSTAENFVRILGPGKAQKIAQRAVTASIGPVTSETLNRLGLNVDIEANPSTVHGLVQAIERYFN